MAEARDEYFFDGFWPDLAAGAVLEELPVLALGGEGVVVWLFHGRRRRGGGGRRAGLYRRNDMSQEIIFTGGWDGMGWVLAYARSENGMFDPFFWRLAQDQSADSFHKPERIAGLGKVKGVHLP